MLRSWLATVSCALALSYVTRDAGSLARAEETRPVASGSPPVRLYGRNDPLLPVRLDAHASLTWDGNFGLGGRVDFPLISGTFRYSTRDELAISAGGDITFVGINGSQHVEVFPQVALQWSLGVDDRFYFFPELGFSAHVIGNDWDGFYPTLGFGARYYLRRSLSLQGRLGWPIALSAGATF